MINRDKVLKQTEQAAQRSGRFRYLRKNSTTNLRVLEYEDKGGDLMFAQQQVEHRRQGQGGRSIGVCRREVFGLPCAFCRANQIARDSGHDIPFVSRTRYVINAINVDEDPKTVRLFVVPTTVFTDITEYVLDDEWADVLEPKTGYAFSVKREGEGLETQYSLKPQRKPYPVDKAVVKQVVDPLEEILDPGLDGPCAEIGVSVGDLFTEDEIQEIADDKPDKKSPKASKGKVDREETTKKTTKKAKKSAKSHKVELKVGDTIKYLEEDDVCHIVKIDGESVTIEDADGQEWDVTTSDLTLTIKSDTEDAPKCFGDENLYDEDDDECQKCEYFDECGGNVDLDKAGLSNKKKPAKKSKDDTAEERDADDIVSSIVGGGKKRR